MSCDDTRSAIGGIEDFQPLKMIKFQRILEEGKILMQVMFGSENPEVQPERPLVSQSTLCKITKLSVGQIRYRLDQFKIHGCR